MNNRLKTAAQYNAERGVTTASFTFVPPTCEHLDETMKSLRARQRPRRLVVPK